MSRVNTLIAKLISPLSSIILVNYFNTLFFNVFIIYIVSYCWTKKFICPIHYYQTISIELYSHCRIFWIYYYTWHIDLNFCIKFRVFDKNLPRFYEFYFYNDFAIFITMDFHVFIVWPTLIVYNYSEDGLIEVETFVYFEQWLYKF